LGNSISGNFIRSHSDGGILALPLKDLFAQDYYFILSSFISELLLTEKNDFTKKKSAGNRAQLYQKYLHLDKDLESKSFTG